MKPGFQHRFETACRNVTGALLAELGPEGHWSGELSGSALATATAVVALATVNRSKNAELIHRGLHWLSAHANDDGGWGDTVRSRSNLSTTALAWAAFGAAQADRDFASAVSRAKDYLARQTGSLEKLVPAIEARYGQDRTFSVPITMTLALSGRLGDSGWQWVRPLPFEIAALPRSWFGALRLPVVSYALPALIAIGQVIHYRAGRWNPLRSLARQRTLNLLTTLQPPHGGFLEATPLTSFVTMSLAGMEQGDHIVARRGAEFLSKSVRPDGSWPIDTNLATWITTLAIKALRHQPGALTPPQQTTLCAWLINQQYRAIHPYTGAAPGGWAWTDLPGGVPDADDTAGALLALHLLSTGSIQEQDAIPQSGARGVEWLLNLQNRDGGIPTFCRGWGALPFDRSTPELTAHALRAWKTWLPALSPALRLRVEQATARALVFLSNHQHADGAWLPLWFGNEHAPQEENPVYGTTQVLAGLSPDEPCQMRQRGLQFLRAQQNADGGWGGAQGAPSTLEETALAVEALAQASAWSPPLQSGAAWLVNAVEREAWREAAPIGLYFARLWYFERLYPLVFTVSALGRLNASTFIKPK